MQIQILLHFLVLSLPGAPPLTTEEPRPELPTHLSPSKKKRRRSRKEATPPPPLSLEAYLELFMDKFSMWQLVATVNGQDTERKRAKGKQKAVDERDWMQVFCEDVVEPRSVFVTVRSTHVLTLCQIRFRSKLPHLCNLLRTKIFPSEPFPGEPDSPLSTPPASPRPAPKRLKTSASSQPASTSRHSASASRRKQPIEDSHALQRARSRSLSVSLEKERARSQSAGVSQKKRTIAREVSMKTAFKGKAQAQARAQRDRESAAARVKDGERGLEAQRVKEAGAGAEKARRAAGAKGVTLVAATPVKAKERGGRSQAQASDVDDARLPKCELERVVEGEENGEDWMLSSSPDVLLLGSNAMPPQRGKPAMNAGVVESDDDDEEEDVLSWMGKNAHLALMDTPTKPKNARR